MQVGAEAGSDSRGKDVSQETEAEDGRKDGPGGREPLECWGMMPEWGGNSEETPKRMDKSVKVAADRSRRHGRKRLFISLKTQTKGQRSS